MSDPNRICYLCEIYKQSSDQKINDQIKLLSDGIDKKERTDDKLLAHRLDICAGCVKLLQNTCRACGCFVELRAARKASHCPDKKW